MRRLIAVAHRKQRARVLVFNCTSGRSGGDFLGAMLAKAAPRMAEFAQDLGLDEKTLFDRVIFCTNVTYADGGFKGGTSSIGPRHTTSNNAVQT